MQLWLLLQGFYHGLYQTSREKLDASAKGSFLSLVLERAEIMLDIMSENQSWTQTNIQHNHQIEEVPEEVSAISTKMETLLNWLNQRAAYKQDRQTNNGFYIQYKPSC